LFAPGTILAVHESTGATCLGRAGTSAFTQLGKASIPFANPSIGNAPTLLSITWFPVSVPEWAADCKDDNGRVNKDVSEGKITRRATTITKTLTSLAFPLRMLKGYRSNEQKATIFPSGEQPSRV
jgi:hypothetical protein